MLYYFVSVSVGAICHSESLLILELSALIRMIFHGQISKSGDICPRSDYSRLYVHTYVYICMYLCTYTRGQERRVPLSKSSTKKFSHLVLSVVLAQNAQKPALWLVDGNRMIWPVNFALPQARQAHRSIHHITLVEYPQVDTVIIEANIVITEWDTVICLQYHSVVVLLRKVGSCC